MKTAASSAFTPSMLSTRQALDLLLKDVRPIADVEQVPIQEANRRVLAADVVSPIDVPPMDTSAMDGYAARGADLAATDSSGPPRFIRVSQRIPAGTMPLPLAEGTAARIFTGAAVPVGADTIVPQEDATANDDGVCVTHPPRPGEWINRRGSDIAAGSIILPAGVRLAANSLGLAASVGLARLALVRRPKIALLATGDELTEPGQPLRPGAIYNSNRFTLRALLENLGCVVTDCGIVADRLDATRDALRAAAAEHDVVLTCGGVSVGDEDHVKPAVEAEGWLDLWRIAVKPGKPLAFGGLRRPAGAQGGRDSAFFIGLPGNPVSSFVTFLIFVRPFLLRLQGVRDIAPRALTLRADFTQARSDRRNEFLRARLNQNGGLDLFPNQGSAVMTSTVWADGLIDNPPEWRIEAGDQVSFLPFSDLLY